MTGEETAAIEVVIRPIKVVAMIESKVITVVIAEIEARIGKIETMIGNHRGMMTSAKHPLDHPETRRMTIERRATRIIIIGMTRGIVIVTEIGAGTATIGSGIGIEIEIGDILGMIGQRIGIEMSAQVITRKRIVRDRDRDREIVRRYRLER